jgi:hypothetical protein
MGRACSKRRACLLDPFANRRAANQSPPDRLQIAIIELLLRLPGKTRGDRVDRADYPRNCSLCRR